MAGGGIIIAGVPQSGVGRTHRYTGGFFKLQGILTPYTQLFALPRLAKLHVLWLLTNPPNLAGGSIFFDKSPARNAGKPPG